MAPPRDEGDFEDEFSHAIFSWVWDRFMRLLGFNQPRRVLLPTGGTTPPVVVSREGVVGTVRAVAGQPKEPVTAAPCVAYAAVFTYGEARDVVLREAATCGFELELEDGGRVAVPAGSCEIALAGCPRRLLEATSRVREIDPRGKEVEALPPFPHDHVQVLVLREGDRVEIAGPLTPLSRTVEGDVGYRTAPQRVLEPQGIPRLTLVARQAPAQGQE